MKDRRNKFRSKHGKSGRDFGQRDRHHRHEKEDFSEHHPPKKSYLKDISIANKGESFIIIASIDRIVQTGGPTVFYVLDGTASLAIKAFEKAGIRAHPHINEGDAIEAIDFQRM